MGLSGVCCEQDTLLRASAPGACTLRCIVQASLGLFGWGFVCMLLWDLKPLSVRKNPLGDRVTCSYMGLSGVCCEQDTLPRASAPGACALRCIVRASLGLFGWGFVCMLLWELKSLSMRKSPLRDCVT